MEGEVSDGVTLQWFRKSFQPQRRSTIRRGCGEKLNRKGRKERDARVAKRFLWIKHSALIAFCGISGWLSFLRICAVAAEPTHMRQFSLSLTAHGDQFCRYRDGNLLWSAGADVEADRCVDAIEQARRKALFL